MQSLEASTDPRVKQGLDAYNQGDYGLALEKANDLLEEDGTSQTGYYLKSIALLAQRKPKESLEVLKTALADHPTDMELQNSAGLVFQNLRLFDKAEERFKWSAKAYPNHPAPYVLLSRLCRERRQIEQEIHYLEEVLKRVPGHVPTMLLLLQVYEGAGDHAKAEIFARAVLAKHPGQPTALASRMRILLDQDKTKEAIQLGEENFQAGRFSPVSDDVYFGALGDAYHRLGEYEKAWQTYLAGAETVAEHYKKEFGDPDIQFGLRNIEKVRTYFESRTSPIQTPQTDSYKDTLFLIGFPRSGTTLLELMLGAHPRITTSHERSTLGFLLDRYSQDESTLDQFFNLDETALEAERATYRDGIADIDHDIFLNKYPLYLSWSGLAAHLLPGSKFILAVRDPRDCVLSAFRQRFRMNPGMYNLLFADTAARYYAATMSAGLAGLKALNIDPIIVKYESLADDPEQELKRVLDAVGLEWDPQIMRYGEADRLEHVHTPSSRQIFKPVSKSAIGQWKNYSSELKTACEILQPWVEHWGYDG